MFDLPPEVQRLIYAYDATYRRIFNLCLLQMMLLFHETHGSVCKVLRSIYIQKLKWDMVNDVPVILSCNFKSFSKCRGTNIKTLCTVANARNALTQKDLKQNKNQNRNQKRNRKRRLANANGTNVATHI